MPSLIENIINVLPAAQQVSAKTLLANIRKSGYLKSLRDQELEASRIQALLNGRLGKLLFAPREAIPGTQLNSLDHNANMEEIFLDLNALYQQAAVLGSNNSQQDATLQSEYDKSKAAILKLLNDVRVFALRKKLPEFNDIKVIDFNVGANQTNKSPSAVVSEEVRLLELRPVYRSRSQLQNRSIRTTSITTKLITQGIRGPLAKNFPPSGMVDQDPNSFWGTIILVDAPLSQRYETQTRDGNPFTIDVQGPIAEIYLTFSHIEKLNVVRLLPFGEFPIKVLDVSYRGSLNSETYLPVGSFQPTTTLDWIEINFEPIYAHEIRITIAQENPKLEIYHIPKSVAVGTDLFQEILDQRAKTVLSDPNDSFEFFAELSAYDQAIQAIQDLNSSTIIDLGQLTQLQYFDTLMDALGQALGTLDQDVLKQAVGLFSNTNPNSQDSIVEVRKYEYLLGMREVELSYEIYSPIGYYESEKFDTQATVSEIQLEVDDQHVGKVTSWEDNYRQTSIEWSVNLGEGRQVPIHPRNQIDEVTDLPSAKDELLQFDRQTAIAFTRLGGRYEAVYRIKQNGELVDPVKYTIERQAQSIPRLKITLDPASFDENSIYTVDYAVSPESYSIQILELFTSRPLATPEVFSGVGPDNDITLSRFPFIDYEVINRSTLFIKDDNQSKWTFTPPLPDISTGQLQLYPTIVDDLGNLLVTGGITGFSITGVYGNHSGEPPINFSTNTGLDQSYFNSPFDYYVSIGTSATTLPVSTFYSGTIVLEEPPILTISQIERLPIGAFFGDLTGASKSGLILVDYKLGIGIETDGNIYALGNNTYIPLTVQVGGREATNITDYINLRHPAFSVGTQRDGQYEYIQAGKKIYLSQNPNGASISANYNWITENLQVDAIVRCHKPVAPDLTPKVNEYRLLLQTMVI